MLTANQLCEQLGITTERLKRWVNEGLPYITNGRGKPRTFDGEAVAVWLVSNGKAKPAAPEKPAEMPSQVCTTRHAAAQALGVNARTLANWLTDPTFPGKAGSPGRQDGYFPLVEIEAWRQERFGVESKNGEGGELTALRARKLQLEIDQMHVSFEKECGTILDAHDVAAWLERHISTAKTILDSMPDKIEAKLPQGITPKIRAKIRAAIEQTIAEACESIAAASMEEDEAEETEDKKA